MRYKIILSYDGGGFRGWQIQPDAPSVQGMLQDAIGRLTGEEVCVTGAGRTDTGVNAVGYVAHFDLASPVETGPLRYKLNAILPKSVAISDISEAVPGFHARFDARRREYTYFIHRKKDPFADRSFLCAWPILDFDAMNDACRHIVGTHDFSCFEKTGSDNRSSVCTVFEAGWYRTDDDHWYFRIAADRFLRNMVRATVGTLLEVGRGKRTADSIPALLESADRCSAGESVPGEALFLTHIDY